MKIVIENDNIEYFPGGKHLKDILMVGNVPIQLSQKAADRLMEEIVASRRDDVERLIEGAE